MGVCLCVGVYIAEFGLGVAAFGLGVECGGVWGLVGVGGGLQFGVGFVLGECVMGFTHTPRAK